MTLRDLPRVLVLKNLLPLETLHLAGVTSIPRDGTITLELFKVSEVRRAVVYQAILNSAKAKCLEIVSAELPSHLVPAPSAEASSPASAAGSGTQDVPQVPPVAEAPVETAPALPVQPVVEAPPVVETPPAPPAPPALPVESTPAPAIPEPSEPADPAGLGQF